MRKKTMVKMKMENKVDNSYTFNQRNNIKNNKKDFTKMSIITTATDRSNDVDKN